MATGNLLDNTALLDFLGDLTCGPLADGAPGTFGRLTGQRYDPADWLVGHPRWRAWPRRIRYKRSATLSSSPATAWRATQRVRHRRTVSTSTPSWRAIWLLLAPAVAASTIRARNASCCGVV